VSASGDSTGAGTAPLQTLVAKASHGRDPIQGWLTMRQPEAALSDRGGYFTHGLPGMRGMAAVLKDLFPVRWAGRRAVVALPEHMDVSNAGQIGEELLSVIGCGQRR
jgi:hypothetical protein